MDIQKIDLFSVGIIGLNLFCKSIQRIHEISEMENTEDVKKVTQNMVDDWDITENIQELFLKMLRNSTDITITLD